MNDSELGTDRQCQKKGCENTRAIGQLFCDEHLKGSDRTERVFDE